jgi:hypothetical protein
MVGEILNEPSIEIGEAKEQLHLFLVRWNRPFSNSAYLDGIHTDGIVRYDDSEILYLHTFKLAFLQFKKEVTSFCAGHIVVNVMSDTFLL